MNIEQQVCSLDLAKRLKELGVRQQSCAYWSNGKVWPYTMMTELDFNPNCYAAFTVAELGEMLPARVNRGDESIGERVDVRIFTSDHSPGKWDVWYEGKDANDYPCDWYYQTADNEADARAKMLIYLIENKLVTV